MSVTLVYIYRQWHVDEDPCVTDCVQLFCSSVPHKSYVAFVAPSASQSNCISLRPWSWRVWIMAALHSTASLSVWWIGCSQCSMRLQDWCITVVNTTAFHHFCATCTGCASLNASSFVWPFLCSAVATRLHRTTWRETYSGQTRTTRGDDCDRRQRTIGDRAFGAVAPRVWNDLPVDIVSAPSLAIFKRRLKTHLFGQSFGWQLTLLPVLEALLTAG